MPKRFSLPIEKEIKIVNNSKQFQKLLKNQKNFKTPDYKKIIDLHYNLKTSIKIKNKISKIFNE